MERVVSLAGWLVAGLLHIFQFATQASAMMAPFPDSDFRWDRRRGVYICPNNKVLHTTGTVHDGNMLRYRASKFDCDVCALKARCCPNMLLDRYPVTFTKTPAIGATTHGDKALP